MLSVHDPVVEPVMAAWLAERGEVFVEVHQPRSGGSGDWYFVRSAEQFAALRAGLRPKAVLIARRADPFAWRGVVAPERAAELLALIPDGSWYALVSLAPYPAKIDAYGSGNSHRELLADIADVAGMELGCGDFPLEPHQYWLHEGTETIIVAQQPG